MRRLALVLVALGTLAARLSAQAHPDFSGKWELDPKSIEGANGMGGPVSMTLTVTQDAKIIKVAQQAKTPMGENATTTSYNVDGSPSKNTVSNGGNTVELTSTGSWDGPVFVVVTKGDVQGQAVTYTERWSLGQDGKTLHLQRDISAMGQSMSLKLTFNKV
jgi:hypothetical protein